MTEINGIAFTQLTNLNVVDNFYVDGVPFSGQVTAPLSLVTSDPLVSPLTLSGGATNAAENYTVVNSGLRFFDADTNGVWHIWASNPDGAAANGGNLYMGKDAGRDQPTATENVAAGQHNHGIGFDVLSLNITGNDNTALGFNSLRQNVSGQQNTAVGSGALEDIDANNNTAIGYNALAENLSGTANVAVGSLALPINMADKNTAVGHQAGRDLTDGEQNVAVGSAALQKETTGNNNVAVGQAALQNAATGGQNTALGRAALNALVSGSNNIAIGHSTAVSLVNGSGNTYIGNGVDVVSDEDNQLNLCNVISADLSVGLGAVTILMPSAPGASGTLYSNSGVVTVSP